MTTMATMMGCWFANNAVAAAFGLLTVLSWQHMLPTLPIRSTRVGSHHRSQPPPLPWLEELLWGLSWAA